MEDGSEVKINLDPTNPETFGFPDIEYSIQQQITSDSEVFSEINIEENPYELSIDLKTNGYAESNLYVSESGYSTVIDNEAMVGFSTDIEMDNIYNPENIVLKYKIKDGYIDNTLGIYSDYEEFQGIKRLNVFKFHEDTNMLLPVETKFDIENNIVYAEVDELGTYCLMDLEIWFNNLGIEKPNENAIESSIYSNMPVTMFSSNNDSIIDTDTSGGNLVWTPTFTNQPIDIVFILQSEGLDEKAFKASKLVIQNYSEFLFSNYNDVRIMLITFGCGKTDTVYNNSASMYLTSTSDVREALSKITYNITSGRCHTAQSFSKVFYEINYQQGSYRSVYRFINGNTETELGFDATITHLMGINSYSEIYNPTWQYVDNYYNRRIKQTIEGRNDIFEVLSDSTTSKLINHIKSKVNDKCAVYNVFLPTNWKKITLKGQLSPTNNINSDEDSLTDWEEVDKDKLVLLDNNDYTLPYTTISHLIGKTEHIYTDDPEWLFNIHEPIYYLPVISDPTMEDSDKDGILDHDEYTNLTTDSRYDNLNPLKTDTLETLYPEFSTFNKNNPIYITVNENNIIINANIKFEGDTDVVPSDFYKTYKEAVIEGIKEHWEINFIGSIYDFYPGMAISTIVNINDVDGSLFGVKSFKMKIYDETGGSYRKGDTWSQAKMKYIMLNLNGKSFEEVKSVAAHEFGHNLGLKDAYGAAKCNHEYAPTMIDFNNPQNNEIWYERSGTPCDSRGLIMWMEGYASANDIEMVLQAFIDNKIQFFVPYGKKQHISKAIKSGANVYVNKSDGIVKYYQFDYSKYEFILIGDADAYKNWIEINYGITLDIGDLNDAW